MPDPSAAWFRPFFPTFDVYGGVPFIARRLYVYSSIISNPAQFKDPVFMKEKISQIWDKKNPVTDPAYKKCNFLISKNKSPSMTV